MESDRIQVTTAASALEAFISIEPGDALEPVDGLAAVETALAEAAVTTGVDRSVVEFVVRELADGDTRRPPISVASAVPPKPGRAERLVPAFALDIRPGTPRGDGTIDFRDRQLLRSVEPGTVVGRYEPPVSATDGIGVDGSVLVAPPIDEPRLDLGPGVDLEPAGEIRATIAGVVKWDGAVGLDVVAALVHVGDVDLESGHLWMTGDIVVQGAVRAGFVVRATGDVEIGGDVEGGTVSAGGDIRVAGTVVGESALVSAGGHLTARRAQNATVRARGGITLDIDAVDAKLTATDVWVRGVVRGGRTASEMNVTVSDAGGLSVGAQLVAGVPVEWPDDTARTIARRASAVRRGSVARRSRAGDARRRDASERGEVAARRARRRARRETAERLARIDVTGRARAGVVVQVGDRRLTLADDCRRVRFRLASDLRSVTSEELP